LIEASGLEEVPEAFFVSTCEFTSTCGWLRRFPGPARLAPPCSFSGGKQPRKFCPVAGNVHVYVIK
ncbi:hypothetical protein, partial [Phocaeicola dorei]|uniref:hypothetical protein n=1 Tax=Phocaeicola dorei TaxID=357276 RepID=UPI0022E0B764